MELSDYIAKINKKFVKEALDSPNLMSDMAMMEKYMSESYNDRILVELLQNADDALSKKVILSYSKKYIYFANNGRDFNESDLEAISRSGNSNKKRGINIGYRGVGFKSSTAISNEIYIFSANTIFSFSKSVCAKTLQMDDDNVPTVRIPFLLNNESVENELKENVRFLNDKGYTTIFAFKTDKHNKISEELKELNSTFLLFLKNVEDFEINWLDTSKKLTAQRLQDVVTLDDEYSSSSWKIINDNNIQLGFKYENDVIIPCEKSEAVYHCFLPTFDSLPYCFKVNADFPTDPSRKHLTLDENTEHLITRSAELLIKYIQNNIDVDTGIFDVLNNIISFSKTATIFQNEYKKQLQKKLMVSLNNNSIIPISKLKIFNDIFEPSEIKDIRKNSTYINEISPKNLGITDKYISNFTLDRYSIEDYCEILKDGDFVENSSVIIVAKLYSIIINDGKLDWNKLDGLYIPCKSGKIRVCEASGSDLDQKFLNFLSSFVVSNKYENFMNHYGFAIKNREGTIIFNNVTKTISNVNNTYISKWKSAEEQCVLFEEHLGNHAKGVGSQNLGYDVESITPDGKKRYIEVKSVSSTGEFVMTNNEYSAANIYKNNYYMCLIHQNDEEVSFTYIRNPIDNLDLEKRVKAWEWVCNKYSGESYKIKLCE